MRFREVMGLAQGHTARKWKSQDWNHPGWYSPTFLTPLLTISSHLSLSFRSCRKGIMIVPTSLPGKVVPGIPLGS